MHMVDRTILFSTSTLGDYFLRTTLVIRTNMFSTLTLGDYFSVCTWSLETTVSVTVIVRPLWSTKLGVSLWSLLDQCTVCIISYVCVWNHDCTIPLATVISNTTMQSLVYSSFWYRTEGANDKIHLLLVHIRNHTTHLTSHRIITL